MTGKELRVWREAREMSQGQLAAYLEVDRKTVGRWEAAFEREVADSGEVEERMRVWDTMSHALFVDGTCPTSDVPCPTSDVPDVPMSHGTCPTPDGTWDEMREMVRKVGGQVTEEKVLREGETAALRRRVFELEEAVKELRRMQGEPGKAAGEIDWERVPAKGRPSGVGFPKPGGKGWRSYDKPGGER